MVDIYYRTAEAIARNPLAFMPPKEGVDKNDYEKVFEWRTNCAPPLEEIFRMMNVIDGNELPVKLQVRSMMCGDVIVDEVGDVWFCAAAGWQRINW